MRYIFILFFLTALSSFSQSISGVVIDGEFNEPLPFANVSVKGTTKGTTTDIDGKYQIKIDPGTYTLSFSFVGYVTVEITEVVVQPNKDTFVEVTLKPSENQLEAVVVKTTLKQNTEASVLQLQKKAVGLLDGLSSQSIRKTGDSNIAVAIKRVPGISVQDGKYVYVRGLGDRYSKTLVNGLELPGLDPDRNTLPLDIFPTNLIDNLLVKKSASADIGADFTGGTIDIILKDFSYSPSYNVSFSTGYNPNMHFNRNFLTDDRSSTDWRAKDDGLRDLPIDPNLDLPLPSELFPSSTTRGTVEEQKAAANLLTTNTKKLNKTMAPNQQTSNMNYSFGVSASNGYKFKEDGETAIGYIAALGYKSNTDYFDDFRNGRVLNRAEGPTEQELFVSQLGRINNFVSLLLGIGLKTKNHKFGVNYIDLLNGESNASNVEAENFDENVFEGVGSIITYTERQLKSIPIYGKHSFFDGDFEVNWKVAQSQSKLRDKDFRKAIFEIGRGRAINPQGQIIDTTFFTISPSVTEAPTRLWRDLDEESLVAKLDLETKIKINKITGKLSAGFSHIDKERDFSTKRIDINYRGDSRVLLGNPNAILQDENIWVQSDELRDPREGSFIIAGAEPSNSFNAKTINTAFYLSGEFKFSDSFRAILGLRHENFTLNYTGIDPFATSVEESIIDDERFIDENELFTNINLIYSPTEDSNIRASYYKTTARPSFKEASTAVIADPITETFFIGNRNIKSALIDNFDLRYEIFGERNQMFSFSLYAKQFDNPIEIQNFRDDTPNEFIARNNIDAIVYGSEIEFRVNLASINDNFKLNLTGNGSYTFSSTNTIINPEDLSDPDFVPDTEERALQGQSPYTVNAGLNGIFEDINLQGGIYYNVQGPAIQFVGVNDIPDIFSEPFHNLDFSAQKEFKSDKATKRLTFRVRNILQDKRQSFYVFDDEKVGVFSQLEPGITFSLAASITF